MKTGMQMRRDSDGDDTNFTNWHEFQILSPNSWQFVQFVSLWSSLPHTHTDGDATSSHFFAIRVTRVIRGQIILIPGFTRWPHLWFFGAGCAEMTARWMRDLARCKRDFPRWRRDLARCASRQISPNLGKSREISAKRTMVNFSQLLTTSNSPPFND